MTVISGSLLLLGMVTCKSWISLQRSASPSNQSSEEARKDLLKIIT